MEDEMNSDERLEHVRAVLSRHKAKLLALPGVTGVGIGAGDQKTTYSIVLYVQSRSAGPKDLSSIEGVTVEYVETGTIELQPTTPKSQ